MEGRVLGRVLGIDIGLKRTGLAVSDALGISVRPLPNHQPKSRKEDVDFVLGLCEQEGVSVIVIGYAVLPQSGNESPMARRARGFKEALDAALSESKAAVEVVLIDECYTSKNAVKRLIESGIKKEKRKQMLDSEVARMLVEEYLARTRPSQ